MKDLIIKATATNAKGFYWRSEGEWRGLAPEAAAWFSAQMAEMTGYIEQAGKNKSAGDLDITLQAVVDGASAAPLTVSGITRKELSKFQRMAAKSADQLIGFGEKLAGHK